MRRQRWLGVIFAVCMASQSGCSDDDHQVTDANVAPDVPVQPDVAPIPDAAPPDASIAPVGVPHDYCGAPFFKLDIGGDSEDVWGYSLSANAMSYARGPRNSMVWDAYMLELDTCLERRLTTGSSITHTFIRGTDILWIDNRDWSEAPNYYCMDIYRYDLGTWSMEQLTDEPACEWAAETNGRHIAYERSTAEGSGAPRENLLWDLQTDNVIQFAEPGSNAGYFDLSDRYLAWSRYPSGGSSLGKDVFYQHLETGDTTQIPNSALYYCYDVRLGGEYLTYAGSEYWGQLPFHLFLQHLPTGEELHLDGGPTINGITHGAIDAGIVAWNTTKHAVDFDPFDPTTDVELYDIETDAYRRLTTARSALRVWDLQVPWITFIVSLGEYVYEYYVAHLERLGVVDANGRLLPGDAVLEPPL